MPFGLKYDSIENYLKSYGKYIVRQARRLLKPHDATGKLSSSLKYKIVKDEDGMYDLQFLASKYAAFVNLGVSGNKGRRTYINIEGKFLPTCFIEYNASLSLICKASRTPFMFKLIAEFHR